MEGGLERDGVIRGRVMSRAQLGGMFLRVF